MEKWKKINNFRNYIFSDSGNIIVLPNEGNKYCGSTLKKGKSSNGYEIVHLKNDSGRRTIYLVHRLIAEIFVYNPDPSNKNVVNHIDGNKKNNHASNLEWVSYSENNLHAYKTGLKKPAGGGDHGQGFQKGVKNDPRNFHNIKKRNRTGDRTGE